MLKHVKWRVTKELRVLEYPGYSSWFLNCVRDQGHCWGKVLQSWVPNYAVSQTLENSLTFNMGLQNLEGGIWNRSQWMVCEGNKPSYSKPKFNQLVAAESKGALEYLYVFLSDILLPVGNKYQACAAAQVMWSFCDPIYWNYFELLTLCANFCPLRCCSSVPMNV